ncbi:MAG: VUT family protein [Patescibacteria group bacterium]
MLLKYRFSILYVVALFAVMYGFNAFPLLIPIPFTADQISLWVLIVGTWFILRDYAQRELGHYILLLMSVAVLLGFLTSAPGFALASITAICLSELGDYIVYTFVKGPFTRKVILSSIVGTVTDTLVFFYLADLLVPEKGFQLFTLPALVAGVIGKMIAVYVWYNYLGGKTRHEFVK